MTTTTTDTFGRTWLTLGPDDTYCPTCGQPDNDWPGEPCDHVPLDGSSVRALGGTS